VKHDLFLEGVRELESLGFRVRYREDVWEQHRYLAGPDSRRAEEITELLTDPEVRAVFCARGGYGWLRLLDLLDWELLSRDPKLLIGFSDATPALNLMVERGVPSIHGPMVAWDLRQGESAYDRQRLLHLLTSPEPAGKMRPGGLTTLREGAGEGVLMGGCLPLLAAVVGTPYTPDLSGSVLLLEDWNSRPYQIDRALQQLRHAGVLEGLAAVVFGEMLGCRQTEEDDYSIQEVLLSCLEGTGFPVLFGFPSGHVSGGNTPLPLGIRTRAEGGDEPTLTVLEPVVS
jgi:muramoyltetrapeptide carboxypeptidase